jgi:hypothetical protein
MKKLLKNFFMNYLIFFAVHQAVGNSVFCMDTYHNAFPVQPCVVPRIA